MHLEQKQFHPILQSSMYVRAVLCIILCITVSTGGLIGTTTDISVLAQTNLEVAILRQRSKNHMLKLASESVLDY
jgi:hypothetical protein